MILITKHKPLKSTSNCFNYHIITQIPHAGKIILKIILQQLGKFMELELLYVQAGFRKESGNLLSPCQSLMIMEKSREYQ